MQADREAAAEQRRRGAEGELEVVDDRVGERDGLGRAQHRHERADDRAPGGVEVERGHGYAAPCSAPTSAASWRSR
jgi:hypothetical protein